jgi:AhpD family alkylhydroperoxidase
MEQRLDWLKAAPGVPKALFGLQSAINESGLELPLLELVKMRASQINGCAYCLDMHSKDARATGETEQRLYLLNAWREAAHLYSERERAALAWTEAVTLLTSGHVPDAVYEQARGSRRRSLHTSRSPSSGSTAGTGSTSRSARRPAIIAPGCSGT